jgi:hypothetical protein
MHAAISWGSPRSPRGCAGPTSFVHSQARSKSLVEAQVLMVPPPMQSTGSTSTSRIRESIADEVRWLAVLTASLLDTEPWPSRDERATTLWDRSLIA